MKAGDTFLGSLSGGDTRHLWVLITNANDRGEVAIVNLTTKTCEGDLCWKKPRQSRYCRQDDDGQPFCRVGIGKHPFITEPTWVRYRSSRLPLEGNLKRAIKSGLLIPHETASPNLVKRIRSGAVECRFTPRKVAAEAKQALND
jgi:hypothetical protein